MKNKCAWLLEDASLCALDAGHAGDCDGSAPSFLDAVNARIDDLEHQVAELRSAAILGMAPFPVADRILVRQPEALPTVAPSEPNSPLPEWRDITELELDGPSSEELLAAINEPALEMTAVEFAEWIGNLPREEPPPLPAIGTRVRIEVSFPRVAKVVRHENGGVWVELPGDSKLLWIAGDDVQAEG